jgi:hypothetical protein
MKTSGNYLHIRNDTGEIFYVGLGNEKRAHKKDNRNTYWARIVNKHGYTVKYLGDRSVEEAKALEKSLIKIFGRKDLKTGSLINMTDGGDGVFNLAKESKEKIGESSKQHMTGRVLPDEWRNKMVDGLRKYYKNNKGPRAGQKMSEAENKKRSESLKKFYAENFDACQQRSIRTKDQWNNQEIRNNRLNGLRISSQKEEYKEKKKLEMLQRYESKEERAKTGAHSKSVWDNYTEQERKERIEKQKKAFAQRKEIAKILNLKTNAVTKEIRLANLHLLNKEML